MRKSLTGMAVLAAMAMAVPAISVSQPAPQVVVNAPKRAKKGLFTGYTMPRFMLYGTKGASINMATQKRAARKAKNKRAGRAK